MSTEEYISKLDLVIKDLSYHDNGQLMVELGENAVALNRKRILERGENAEGGQYAPYSTTPMLANCSSMSVSACNQIAGSKKKRKDLKWVTIGGSKLFEIPGGYKQFRELHGRQTGFVDFSFSGRMWANIKLKSTYGEHVHGVARIGATEPDNNRKLEGNTKRRGDILKLSKSEMDELMNIYTDGILKIFQRYGIQT